VGCSYLFMDDDGERVLVERKALVIKLFREVIQPYCVTTPQGGHGKLSYKPPLGTLAAGYKHPQ
jgi:hypothetical protein